MERDGCAAHRCCRLISTGPRTMPSVSTRASDCGPGRSICHGVQRIRMGVKEKKMAVSGYSLSTLNQFIGQEIGVSEWVTVDQKRINQFAESTGDHQWIHVDMERAKRESPFQTTIAH